MNSMLNITHFMWSLCRVWGVFKTVPVIVFPIASLRKTIHPYIPCISNKNNPALKYDPSPPTPIVKARVYRTELDSFGDQTWIIDCPYGNHTHTHGGREGRRWASCTDINPSYIIEAP